MEIERPNIVSSRELDVAEAQRIVQLKESSQQAIPDSDSWIEEELHRNVLLTTVDFVLDQARARSTFPLMFGLACCAFEMIGTAASRFDATRWGMDIFRCSPP